MTTHLHLPGGTECPFELVAYWRGRSLLRLKTVLGGPRVVPGACKGALRILTTSVWIIIIFFCWSLRFFL